MGRANITGEFISNLAGYIATGIYTIITEIYNNMTQE